MRDLPPILSRPLVPPPIIDQRRTGGPVGAESGPAAPQSWPFSGRPRLSAGPATIILLVFLGAQFGAVLIVSMIAGFFLGVMHAAHHVTTPVSQEIAQSLPWIFGWGTIFGTLAGGMAVAKVSASLIREHLGDTSALGAAWVYGRLKDSAQGLGVGVLVGLGFFLVVALFVRLGMQPSPGPFSKMATTPGFPQVAFIACALFLAPPVEELLFRGVLYGGYRRSFGLARAAALTTGIFVVLHLGEIIHLLPAAFGITGMALAALWFRLRKAAIGPAVAVHFGYNLVIVSSMAVAVWTK